jgi:hypothetical protein
MQQQTIIKFNTYNPRRNLPPSSGKKRGEANFLGTFVRTVCSTVFTSGYGGKQFSLSNYGIADFVWVKPDKNKKDSQNSLSNESIYAFETKLKDWRKAFQQAYRYSYFADVSCVVIPPEISRPALNNVNLFETCNVGLWLFDAKKLIVDQVFTPKEGVARNALARERAFNEINTQVNFS